MSEEREIARHFMSANKAPIPSFSGTERSEGSITDGEQSDITFEQYQKSYMHKYVEEGSVVENGYKNR